jgi:DNA-binding transcriptional ArsR family regulator
VKEQYLLLVYAERRGQNVVCRLGDRRVIKAITLLRQVLNDTRGNLAQHLGEAHQI